MIRFMPGSSPKRKGDGYERELAKYFNEKIFNGEDKVCLLYTSPSPRDRQ